MEADSPAVAVPASEVREQLGRILASPPFRNGPRLSRLLRFLVESSLDGRNDSLKEYVLGTEVFERASFDPRVDTVVRSTARHLRFKLDEYYKTEGQGDGLFIELPKGTYVPVFRRRVAPVTADSPLPRRLSWRAFAAPLATAIIAAAATGLLVRARMSPVIDSMAVLPFENRTGRPADQYLTDGLTEELTGALVRFPRLRVVTRASASAASQHNEDIRKVAGELNVEAVLTGSVERSGDHARLSARLVAGHDGRALWSGTFEFRPADIASVETMIVEATARNLHLPAPEGGAKHDTANPEAHDLYIQGRYCWSRRDAENIRQSVALFDRAIAEDPSYALAYTGLADAYGVMAANDMLPPAEALRKAEEAAGRALALDPQLTEAHASLGLIKNAEWDWRGAERELRLALDLNPGYAATYQRLALNLTVHGRFEEAEALLRHAQTLDPLNWMLTYNLGENAYYARRYDEAIAQANRIRSLMPGAACNLLHRAYFQKGMLPEARAAMECEYQSHEGFDAELSRATLMEDAAAGAVRFRSLVAKAPPVGPFFVAWTAARLHQTGLALTWLEKAYAAHTPDLASIRVEPALDSLHDEPRYREVLKRVGLAE